MKYLDLVYIISSTIVFVSCVNATHSNDSCNINTIIRLS